MALRSRKFGHCLPVPLFPSRETLILHLSTNKDRPILSVLILLRIFHRGASPPQYLKLPLMADFSDVRRLPGTYIQISIRLSVSCQHPSTNVRKCFEFFVSAHRMEIHHIPNSLPIITQMQAEPLFYVDLNNSLFKFCTLHCWVHCLVLFIFLKVLSQRFIETIAVFN